jgi:hypothetical protein
MTEIRDYRDADAASWLQCRLLSFFGTEYYDDVVVERPVFSNPAYRLVAVENDTVVGLMDVELFPDRATIDVLAIQHPDPTENFRYLQVYKSWQDDADGFETPEGLGKPVHAFMHAPVSLETSLRERFSRIHVCRQYVRTL